LIGMQNPLVGRTQLNFTLNQPHGVQVVAI